MRSDLLACIGSLAFIALLAALLTGALNVVARLQARVFRRQLRKILEAKRGRIFLNRGLAPRRRLLLQMTTEEANQILHAGWTDRGHLPRGALNLERRIRKALENVDVLADFRSDERRVTGEQLLGRVAAIERSWHRTLRVVACCVGVGLAITLQYRILNAIAAAWDGSPLPGASWPWWGQVIGALCAGILGGLAAAPLVIRYFEKAARLDTPVGPAALELPASPTAPHIGAPGRPIRAINFSSGGFDTFMHLGVTQALVVIQGRAPDAVVGLSAGAIHAVALAEVLQAGDSAERGLLGASDWQSLSPPDKNRLQHIRQLARVERLRHFIEQAQRAPERLLDAILPDTYQIDSGRPLQPLQQPRLARVERQQRGKFVVTRSGLARLYNDVLNVSLKISTITKIVRRALGLVATSEISNGWLRWAARDVEILRLWALLGANLLSVAKLSRIVFKALWIKPSANGGTAGALIFRSKLLQKIGRGIFYAAALAILLALWMTMSIGLAPPALLFMLVVLAIASLRKSRDARLMLTDGLQGAGVLIGLVCAWSALLWCIGYMIAMTTHEMPAILALASHLQSRTALIYCWPIFFSAALLIGCLGWLIRRRSASNPRSPAEQFLTAYGLGDAIFREHGLRTFLAEIFDPNLYARVSISRAVEAALDNCLTCEPTPEEQKSLRPPRTLADFFDDRQRLERERIHIGVAVANTEDGTIDVVPSGTPVVDALLAATAVTPFFPPVELIRRDKEGRVRKVLYTDGANVTQEPTHALLKLLRRHRHPDAGQLYVYSVSPFPLSRNEIGEPLVQAESVEDAAASVNNTRQNESGKRFHEYLDLVDIVWRALRLQRFRDAGLERRLTELFTCALPTNKPLYTVPEGSGDSMDEGEKFFRAWVTPVELDYDADLNRRLYRGAKEDRRRIIAESIADGCRAALQVMIPEAIKATAVMRMENGRKFAYVAKCKTAVSHRLAQVAPDLDPGSVLPGSNPSVGPGLAEICEHCSLYRPDVGRAAPAPGSINAGSSNPAPPLQNKFTQSLRLDSWDTLGPSWPHERQTSEVATPNQRFHRERSVEQESVRQSWKSFAALQGGSTSPWPPARELPLQLPDVTVRNGKQRPLVSLLFSGGVFRGVYQVGVLNALNELGLKPDLIAGASVGSITAAMIAEAFSLPDTTDRGVRIARLAGVYLAIDRLILTDRFADFVRTFTLRAADARFSMRQADRVFRRYDQPSMREFDRNTRQVVAGIERLFYVSPYRLNEIVHAFRDGNTQQLGNLLNNAIQRFLDRMQVGDQALGAEALRELIEFYVVGDKGGESDHPVGLTVDELRNLSNIMFLATTTNLSRGRLEVLGSIPNADAGAAPVLVESLLASSAFPGVFRPRWSWEVMPGARQVHQYIDGGVMDNLPVDAVASCLHHAAEAGVIAAFPDAPHLIVGASLEVRAPSYALAFTRNRFRNSWLALQTRAKQLGYNKKLDTYEHAERALQRIRQHSLVTDPTDPNVLNSNLVSIHLVSIKPDWLCGTFSFHPMLGFSRRRQAQSIAHGCATTLLEFAGLKNGAESSGHLPHWGMRADAIPESTNWEQAFSNARASQPVSAGRCWLRDAPCPFSEKVLRAHNVTLEREWAERTAFEIQLAANQWNAATPEPRRPQERPIAEQALRQMALVHALCAKRDTHLRPI